MEQSLFTPDLFLPGTKVYLPERTTADGTVYPPAETVVTEAAHVNEAGIEVCRVALWPNITVRVDCLTIVR